jgi:hypothetical protein
MILAHNGCNYPTILLLTNLECVGGSEGPLRHDLLLSKTILQEIAVVRLRVHLLYIYSLKPN